MVFMFRSVLGLAGMLKHGKTTTGSSKSLHSAGLSLSRLIEVKKFAPLLLCFEASFMVVIAWERSGWSFAGLVCVLLPLSQQEHGCPACPQHRS